MSAKWRKHAGQKTIRQRSGVKTQTRGQKRNGISPLPRKRVDPYRGPSTCMAPTKSAEPSRWSVRAAAWSACRLQGLQGPGCLPSKGLCAPPRPAPLRPTPPRATPPPHRASAPSPVRLAVRDSSPPPSMCITFFVYSKVRKQRGDGSPWQRKPPLSDRRAVRPHIPPSSYFPPSQQPSSIFIHLGRTLSRPASDLCSLLPSDKLEEKLL